MTSLMTLLKLADGRLEDVTLWRDTRWIATRGRLLLLVALGEDNSKTGAYFGFLHKGPRRPYISIISRSPVTSST